MEARTYVRNPHMFIDVLGIPSITEAVEEASRLLRFGIIRAMQTNPSTESDSYVTKQSRSKPITPSKSAQRDPVSVYSAVTKLVAKPPERSDDPVKDTRTVDTQRPKPTINAWNSEKKAGPSILSKRSLSSISSSVFQPAPKREKKAESSLHENSNHSTKIEISSTNINLQNSTSRQNSRTTPSSQKLTPPGGTNVKRSSQSPSPLTTANQNIATKSHTDSITTAASKTITPPISKTSLKKSTFSPSGEPRRSGLPPSWSKVASVRTPSKQPSALSLLRKPIHQTQAKLQPTKTGTSLLPSVAQTQTLNTVRATNGNARTGMTIPNITGLQIQYVPGSEVIGGVQPNGYTVSRQGVVKPVVTFNPKPKLLLKLRQNSVEKLFEAWRDHQKLAEGEALTKALRTEQEMYAAASSRVDYRAAVTVKLKEIRK